MNDFDKVMDCIFAVEGYVSNHKADSGGYTKYGIAQKAHPEVNVKTLTLDGAKEIYYKSYWLPTKCDEQPFKVALYVMDLAVNSGVKVAAKALQKCTNLVVSGTPKSPLAVDGIVGKKTILESRSVHPDTLTAALHAYRTAFYFGIVAKNASQKVFLKGWMNRLAKLNMYASGIPANKLDIFLS